MTHFVSILRVRLLRALSERAGVWSPRCSGTRWIASCTATLHSASIYFADALLSWVLFPRFYYLFIYSSFRSVFCFGLAFRAFFLWGVVVSLVDVSGKWLSPSFRSIKFAGISKVYLLNIIYFFVSTTNSHSQGYQDSWSRSPASSPDANDNGELLIVYLHMKHDKGEALRCWIWVHRWTLPYRSTCILHSSIWEGRQEGNLPFLHCPGSGQATSSCAILLGQIVRFSFFIVINVMEFSRRIGSRSAAFITSLFSFHNEEDTTLVCLSGFVFWVFRQSINALLEYLRCFRWSPGRCPVGCIWFSTSFQCALGFSGFALAAKSLWAEAETSTFPCFLVTCSLSCLCALCYAKSCWLQDLQKSFWDHFRIWCIPGWVW